MQQQESKLTPGNDKDEFRQGLVLPPSLNLPKGEGTIQGIDEKFSVNPAIGTAGITVPIFTYPERSGFQPDLTLSYDSGNGNGPFGMGWKLSILSIRRKTQKGLPRCHDQIEDTFILAEAGSGSGAAGGGEWRLAVGKLR